MFDHGREPASEVGRVGEKGTGREREREGDGEGWRGRAQQAGVGTGGPVTLEHTVQGYLTHKKQPPPLMTTIGL